MQSLLFCVKMCSMVKTREIYYEDAYISSFEATVLSCLDSGKGFYNVILDSTAFFPEEGGQTSDVGTLTSEGHPPVRVSHASIKDGVITHRTDGPLEEGTTVRGAIDWEHRFSNMQQHTGEHIFSGIVSSEYGFDNVGFHLSDSEVTMDYSGPLSPEDIDAIEARVNRAIWENIEVLCRFPSSEELGSLEYRSKKELTGDVRIVIIPGYDACACCAPHVLRTGEVGLLKVVSCQNYKGGVRVSILCGKRAVAFLSEAHKLVTELSGFLTTGRDKVFESVTRQKDEIFKLKGELSQAREKLTEYELKQILQDGSKKGAFLVKDDDLDGNEMRKVANALADKLPGISGVFVSGKEGSYRYILASGSDAEDVRGLQEQLKEAFGAKGGGSKEMVQGSLVCDNITEVTGRCEMYGKQDRV